MHLEHGAQQLLRLLAAVAGDVGEDDRGAAHDIFIGRVQELQQKLDHALGGKHLRVESVRKSRRKRQ